MDDFNIPASIGRALQRDAKVDDLQLVLDEGAAGFAVLAAPFEMREGVAVALGDETCSTIREGVGDWRGANRRKSVELRARSVEEAGVKEPA